MNFEGLVVYIKFDGEQNIWDNMIDSKHADYTVLPRSISALQDNLNETFEYTVPLTFRCLYALREFDLVGVFKHQSDAEKIIKQIQTFVSDNKVETLKVNSAYGEVGYPSDEVEFKRIVHKMWGKAVYGAIKY